MKFLLLVLALLAGYFLWQREPEPRFCGGIAGNLPQFQCQKGSECIYENSFPDASGYCAKIGSIEWIQKFIQKLNRPPAENLPVKTVSFACSQDSDCVLGIKTNECCSCPRGVNSQQIGKDGWEVYVQGKNYSSACQGAVACKPCEPPGKITCQNKTCSMAIVTNDSDTETANPDSIGANWKTYTNTKFGYSVQIPSTWQVDPGEPSFVQLGQNIVITATENLSTNLDAFMQSTVPATGAKASEIYKFEKNISVSGKPAIVTNGGCCGFFGKHVFVINGGYFYDIADRSGTDENFDKILSTLKFL